MKKTKTVSKAPKKTKPTAKKVAKTKQNVISIAELYALKKQREQEKASAHGKGWSHGDTEQKGPTQEQFRAVGGRRSGFGGTRHH